jgi:RNA polymerase sigma-70 factor (ECF subfamily)
MITELDDRQLMLRLKKGDIRCLGELYLRYGDMVKAALSRFAPESAAADVDELCQDVFLALNDSKKRYQERTKLKAWIFGIAVRKARMWRRKTWLRRHLLELHGKGGVAMALPSNQSPATTVALRLEIQESLARLTRKQREVVLLHAVQGFSGEEIAEILNIRVGVVWSRLHRARQLLADSDAVSARSRALEGKS